MTEEPQSSWYSLFFARVLAEILAVSLFSDSFLESVRQQLQSGSSEISPFFTFSLPGGCNTIFHTLLIPICFDRWLSINGRVRRADNILRSQIRNIMWTAKYYVNWRGDIPYFEGSQTIWSELQKLSRADAQAPRLCATNDLWEVLATFCFIKWALRPLSKRGEVNLRTLPLFSFSEEETHKCFLPTT